MKRYITIELTDAENFCTELELQINFKECRLVSSGCNATDKDNIYKWWAILEQDKDEHVISLDTLLF